MECKEFEKIIPRFIQKKMDYPTLNDFYHHMENCEECKEELTIHFLVSDGLARLEEGDAFDLQQEWKICVEETERELEQNEMFLKTGIYVEIAFTIFIALIMFFLLI